MPTVMPPTQAPLDLAAVNIFLAVGIIFITILVVTLGFIWLDASVNRDASEPLEARLIKAIYGTVTLEASNREKLKNDDLSEDGTEYATFEELLSEKRKAKNDDLPIKVKRQ